MKNNLLVILSTLIVLFFLPFNNKAQNLVLYTTFDDASSITSPSTGPAGTQNNGSFSAAKYNDGFLSDDNNEYVEFDIGTSSGFESGKLNETTGTIAFWFKPSYNGSDGSSFTESKYIFDIDSRSITIFYDNFNDRITFRMQNFDRAVYTPTWSSGDLVHIAVVWDAAGSNTDIDGGKSIALYINGTVVDWNTATWTPGSTNNTSFRVGCNSGNTIEESLGIIDDLYIYDDVLTSTQINNLKDTQALPVELTSFSANLFENSVKLNWATATEVNNYGFEVERCETQNVRNETWEKIGFVNGHGNSNSPKYYSFVDNNSPSGELKYRLKQIDFDGAFEYSDVVTINNTHNYEFNLAQNYPNPFNPTTTISFTIPNNNNGIAKLKIYDVLGKEVATLVNEQKSPGNYKVDFDASQLSSGMYFYTLTSGSFRQTQKMLLIK